MTSLRSLTLWLLYLLLANHVQHCQGETKKALNEFITYYEPVVFQVKETYPSTSPWRSTPVIEKKGGESAKTAYTEEIEIRAFGRTFQLELSRADKILAPDAEINILTDGESCVKNIISTELVLASLVEGKVTDESSSYVHGALRKGVFTGIIYMLNQTFFVERASKYFLDPMPFDCVIFRQVDLNMTAFDCGMGPEGYKCDPIRLLQRTGPTSEQVLPVLEDVDFVHEKTWFKKNAKKTTCKLKVIADHLFYQHAGENSAENAIYDMIFHVHEADRIFRGTDFDDDGQPDNVGFRIHSIEVYTSSACFENPIQAKSTLTSDQYLEIFSERDFHNYCVGIAFSGLTFPGRVLGIAWMADAENNGYVGGICEPRLFSTQDQKALSFNAAVVTTMLEGRRMPRGITAIAVAHELGHSFGSDHDPYQDEVCSPSDENGGKYIMSAFAVKGDQPNNRYFSPCSKKNMKNVVRKKGTCFTALTTVEITEETKSNECKVKSMNSGSKFVENEAECLLAEKDKVLTEEARECSFVPNSEVPSNQEIHSCRITDDDCFAAPSVCDSASGCSPPQKVPDGSSCMESMGECREGTCVVNPCLLLGQKTCECTDEEKSCIVCCRVDDSAECQPIRRKDAPWWLLRRPGESCKNGWGQCDNRGHCEKISELKGVKDKAVFESREQVLVDPKANEPKDKVPVDPNDQVAKEPKDAADPAEKGCNEPKDKISVEPQNQEPTEQKKEICFVPKEQKFEEPTNQIPSGPINQAPVDPKEAVPGDPKEGVPVNPNDETPVDPKNQLPENPKDKTPVHSKNQLAENPKDQTPVNSNDQTPVDPKNQLPENPKDKTPVHSKNQLPENPKDQTLVNSNDQTPVDPKNQLPENPKDKTPVHLKNQLPENPKDQTPVNSNDQTPVNPKDQTPVDSSDQTLVDPSDQTPKDSSDQTPKDSSGQSPVDSNDQTPLNPKNQIAETPKDQTFLEPKDKLPIDPNVQKPETPQDQTPLEPKNQVQEVNEKNNEKKDEVETLPHDKEKLLVDDSFGLNWNWERIEQDNLADASPTSWVKGQWLRKLFVQVMWVCLGFIVFFVLLFCACFLCPAVAVGLWCLRQCSCWSRQTITDDSIRLIHRESQRELSGEEYYRPDERVSNIDNSANPVPDVQTRSRTF